jgi:hypothetical protein
VKAEVTVIGWQKAIGKRQLAKGSWQKAVGKRQMIKADN